MDEDEKRDVRARFMAERQKKLDAEAKKEAVKNNEGITKLSDVDGESNSVEEDTDKPKTLDEIKAELDAAGVEYNPKAKKAELAKLLAQLGE